MKLNLQSIQNLLYFAEKKISFENGKKIREYMNPTEFEAKENINVDGSIFYYGIYDCDTTEENFKKDKNKKDKKDKEALSYNHRDFFYKLKTSNKKIAILGLEPPSNKENPFNYVDNNLDLVRKLASELMKFTWLQRIIIRYASEMNDPGNNWGLDPDGYKTTYSSIRKIFDQVIIEQRKKEEKASVKEKAPVIEFNFSPAIRTDLPFHVIEQYWPETKVDIVSCTWYIGNTKDEQKSTKNFDDYIKWAKDKHADKRVGIDELGGRDIPDKSIRDDGKMLTKMVQHIIDNNISLDYLTLFLGGSEEHPYKWDVCLEDLKKNFGAGKTTLANDISSDTSKNEQNYARDILVHLSSEKLNHIKALLSLPENNEVDADTIENFLSLCKKYGFDLSENGVNKFKDSKKLGNTGNTKGIIGNQTAVVYYSELIGLISSNHDFSIDIRPPRLYKPPYLSLSILGAITTTLLPDAEIIDHEYIGGKVIYKLPKGEIYIHADMDIDADGSPRAEEIDPGYGQIQTSLSYNGQYVNSEKIPYFVLPMNFYKKYGIKLGDIGAVIYKDKISYAIFADVGPKNKIGEGSIQLAKLLGHNPFNRNGKIAYSIPGDVIYIAFPGSGDSTPQEPNQINIYGKELFKNLGGNPA